MQVSYAQRLEDYHLDQVFGDQASGFYVDIGGGHPVADNVSFHFYLKGWSGIVVEPQADLAAKYAKIRPRDRIFAHLIGASHGEADFHVVDRLHGFSTIVEANAKAAGEFGAEYATIRMPILPLSAVLDAEGVGAFEFLKIDVEGAEAAVLAGIDWRRHRPKVICIEAVQPGNMAEAWRDWEPAILAAGYAFAFFDELNRFYVANEHRDLAERFPKSPTPWGVVQHFYEFGRPHENPGHPDRALADRLIRGFLASLPERSSEEVLALVARSAGGDGLEEPRALRKLMHGKLAEGSSAKHSGAGAHQRKDVAELDDETRAALGRIAAPYDGGMVSD